MEHSGEGQGVAANPASPGFEGQIARIEAMTYDGPPATPQRTSPSTSGSAEPPCIDIWPRTTPPPDQVDADEDGQPPGLGMAIRQCLTRLAQAHDDLFVVSGVGQILERTARLRDEFVPGAKFVPLPPGIVEEVIE